MNVAAAPQLRCCGRRGRSSATERCRLGTRLSHERAIGADVPPRNVATRLVRVGPLAACRFAQGTAGRTPTATARTSFIGTRRAIPQARAGRTARRGRSAGVQWQVMMKEPYASARRVFWIVDNGSAHRGQRSVDRLEGRWPNLGLVHPPSMRAGSTRWRSSSRSSSARCYHPTTTTTSLRWRAH
jgi:hypothetical protein